MTVDNLQEEITLRIRGLAWQRMLDGDWRNESPVFFKQLNEQAVTRNHGRYAYSVTTTGTREVWIDLGEYLASALGAEEAALGDMDSFVDDKAPQRRLIRAVAKAVFDIEDKTGWWVRRYYDGRTAPKETAGTR